MRCIQCEKKAAIALRAYNASFCEDHFISFFENRVKKTIVKYKLFEEGDKILVAVSGGKDSLTLWQVLKRLNYEADGLYIDLGIGDYSELSLRKAGAFAEKLRSRLYVFSLTDTFGKGIFDISKILRRTTCSACGAIKRYVMNRTCIEKGYGVICTGHNLDDEASSLLGNLLYWRGEYLWKKGLLLESREGHLAKKVKPLFLISEKETTAYAIISQIDYVYDECPYSKGAKTLMYKEILNRLEFESPGTKLGFVKGYLRHFRGIREDEKDRLKYCRICGYPSHGERCLFCSLKEKLSLSDGFSLKEMDFR